jgi:hypothetical protein
MPVRGRRLSSGLVDQASTKPVLVDASRCGEPLFEQVECAREKSGQLQKPFGSAIGVGARFECARDETLESRDGSIPSPQLVVEREDFED